MYLDQPMCLSNAGSWVCTITRSSIGREGGAGIHVEALTSLDDGISWESHNLDPSNSTSYSALTQTRFGRWVVLFGLHPPHAPHGYAMRASDDGGASWGPMVAVPLRHTAIDGNGTADSWTVDRLTASSGGVARLALTKYSGPMMAPEEVFILSSPNLLTERNASAVTWSTLPEGPRGLVPPGGAPGVVEEGHVVPLDSGGCFMVARTEQGYLAAAHTADPTCAGGWTDSAFARYWSATPLLTNRALKNPRGPVQLKRMTNGRYLLLFYNNAGFGFKNNRNPYWLSCGVEEGGEVRFSEPELALLEWADETQRPGYPDIVEDAASGAVAFTETNKTHARIHPVPAAFLALLYAQDTAASLAPGAVCTFTAADVNTTLPSPPLPDFSASARSLTVGFWLAPKYSTSDSGTALPSTLMDTRARGAGPGLHISASPLTPGGGVLNVSVSDASGRGAWLATDAPCTMLLTAGGAPHYFAAVLDAAAHVLTVLVDGVLCDGGTALEQGWAWVPPDVGDVTGAATFVLAPSFDGKLLRGHFYDRALLTSELVGNYRAGPGV